MGGLVNIGVRSEGLLDGEYTRFGMTKIAMSASTYSMSFSTTRYLVFEGDVLGQRLQAPDATTLTNGHTYYVINDSIDEFVTMYYYDDTTLLVSLPPNTRTRIILKDNTTTNGEWIFDQSSASTLSSTSFLTYYGGQALTGRILQYVPGEATDTAPYLVVGNSAIVALSLGVTNTGTGSVGVYLSTDLVTPIASISLTAQDSNSLTGLYIPVDDQAELVIIVTSGPLLKPYLTTYLVGR